MNPELIEPIYNKALAYQESYNAFPDRDIRPTFFSIMVNQCSTAYINLTINHRYLQEGSQPCRDLFADSQERVDNYMHHLNQNCLEAIVDAALFQSELVLRTLNAQLLQVAIYDKSTLPQLIARLFEDTENNWQKEESNLIILLSTIRNTIHTGGIYVKNQAGDTKIFKGDNYTFTYGKTPIFPAGTTILDLVSELFDAMKVLFDSAKIAAIGTLEHPNYQAI